MHDPKQAKTKAISFKCINAPAQILVFSGNAKIQSFNKHCAAVWCGWRPDLPVEFLFMFLLSVCKQ